MARYTLTAFSLNGSQRQGLISGTLDYGDDWQANGLDATVHETAHHQVRTAPRATLQVANLALLSALNGSTDAPLVQYSGTGLVLVGLRGAPNAPAYDASGHRSYTMSKGTLFFRRVAWQAGQKAEMELEGLAYSDDGLTHPVAEAAVSFVAPPNTDQGWVLTSLSINGAATPRVQSVEITCDPKAQHDYSFGLPHPTAVIAAGVNGYAEWRLRAVLGGHLEVGNGTGAVTATFTKLAHGGGLGASTVSFTFNAVFSVREQIQGTTGEVVQAAIIARPRLQGATKPVTWSVA